MIIANYPPFRPIPWLSDPHLQTVAAYLFRQRTDCNSTRRFLIKLPDGDALVIHDNQPRNWIVGDRIAILVHGLCGSHRSPYMQRTATKLLQAGIRVVRVDLRGWGDSTLLSRGHAHAGSSLDLAHVVTAVTRLSPISKLTLVGFSLGGNVVLKLAGEWADAAPKNVDSAIAISPPIDLEFSSTNLRAWGNRIYDWFFMNKLRRKLQFRRQHVPGLIDNGLYPLPSRLVHFDDQFLGPVNGYSGARDYYAQASAAPMLRKMTISALIVSSLDDPVVPARMFSDWALASSTELLLLKHGGHLGYLASTRVDPDPFWLDWRLADWISRL